MTAPLVSTDWLARHQSDPSLRILDASWYLPSSGRQARAEYLAGHIPGGRFFDLELASDSASPLPHMLPEAAQFAAYAGTLGVDNDSTVVVYDGSGINLSAPRAWWMFRVSGHRRVAVLDGGIGKWRAETRPLEAGPQPVAQATYHAALDSTMIRGFDQVQQALRSGGAQVVDMRSSGRFEGREPEPRPGIPSGHMPGALNLPFNELVASDGSLLPVEDLARRILGAGVRLDRPVIATCGSGTSACALLLALATLGHENTALYDGSWTEYVSRGGEIA